MKRILFVDREPHVLGGLRSILDATSDPWSIDFCTRGQDALARLDAKPYDAVVSELQMRDIDGLAFLKHVRETHPDVVRIVLSVHSDKEAFVRSTGVAHRFIAKPCEADALRGVLARAFSLREHMSEPRLKELVGSIDALPTVPRAYVEMAHELGRPAPDLSRVADAISRDVAMTAKVLQIANSSYIGLSQPVTSPKQAVSILGLNTVSGLVLAAQVFGSADSARHSFPMDRLIDHSLRTGFLAAAIARTEEQPDSAIEDAQIAGFLHDCGKIVLVAKFEAPYTRLLTFAAEKCVPLWQVEKDLIGATHQQVGGALMEVWGLPHPILEPVAFHHSPAECPGSGFSPLIAVHVANHFEKRIIGALADEGADPLDKGDIERLGLTHRLPVWKQICEHHLFGLQSS